MADDVNANGTENVATSILQRYMQIYTWEISRIYEDMKGIVIVLKNKKLKKFTPYE